MPKITLKDETMMLNTAAGVIQYSAVHPDHLTATKYCLATICSDNSGSVGGFADLLLKCYKASVIACQADKAVAGNILVRATTFQERDINEIHGFRMLKTIDPDKDYQPFNCDGYTPLYDATYDAITSTLDYGKKLMDDDYTVNGIIFVITDGCENSSRIIRDAAKIKETLTQVKADVIESLKTILIQVNVNDKYVKDKLDKFAKDAGFDDVIDAGTADEKSLAKIAGFIHRSTSSTSQVIGSGGPSQAVTF
jgi:hypothetical protein